VERDATTLWKLRKEQQQNDRLDLDSVDAPICQEILRKLERAGLSVAVWDITSDIRIATFACTIVPRDDNALWHCTVASGFGCHPAREIALIRALTEAAQTRLTLISGLRDDFRRDTYEELLDPEVIGAARHRHLASTAVQRFDDVPTHDGATFEEDVAWELKCIRKARGRQVVVVDLTKPEFALPVVRVIVPGLEPILVPDYVPGRRAQGVIAEKP